MVRDALQDQDRVAIVTFSDKAKVRLPLSHPKDESISAVIDSLKTVHPLLYVFFFFFPSLCALFPISLSPPFLLLFFVFFFFFSSHLNLFSLANHLFIYISIVGRINEHHGWFVGRTQFGVEQVQQRSLRFSQQIDPYDVPF